jgi:hypothetical protein
MRIGLPTYVLVFLALIFTGCSHLRVPPAMEALSDVNFALEKNRVELTLNDPGRPKAPYLHYERVAHFAPNPKRPGMPFKKELFLNTDMRNIHFSAQVLKNGKKMREVAAQKIIPTTLSDKQNAYLSQKSKLQILVPFVAPGEQVVLSLSYDWMETRWLLPVFLEEEEPTLASQAIVNVPHGVTMRFQAAQAKARQELAPQFAQIAKKEWSTDNNAAGLGTQYVFVLPKPHQNVSLAADRLQLYFSFETPQEQEASWYFDSWPKLSRFIYDRIDRYELATTEIREFSLKEGQRNRTESQRVASVFAFLRSNIERLPSQSSYLDQEVQPASRTFKRRAGTPFDKVILGEAMLQSMGIESEILVAADAERNPELKGVFSPAIFSRVLLMASVDGKNYFFDPTAENTNSPALPKNLQGQAGLVIKRDGGGLIRLPSEDPEQHQQALQYELFLSPEGVLQGHLALTVNGRFIEQLQPFFNEEGRLMNSDQATNLFLGSGINLGWRNLQLKPSEPGSRTLTIIGSVAPRFVGKLHEQNLPTVAEIIGLILRPLSEQVQDISFTRIVAKVNLPEAVRVDLIPANKFWQSPHADVKVATSVENQQLSVSGQVRVTKSEGQFSRDQVSALTTNLIDSLRNQGNANLSALPTAKER